MKIKKTWLSSYSPRIEGDTILVPLHHGLLAEDLLICYRKEEMSGGELYVFGVRNSVPVELRPETLTDDERLLIRTQMGLFDNLTYTDDRYYTLEALSAN